MRKPSALVISGDGINCEIETHFALSKVGFDARLINVSELLQEPKVLRESQMLVLPGGFAFGDEIASGKVLALKLKAKLTESLAEFVERGSLLLGICNGFQVLVQMGLLPPKEKSDTESKQAHLASLTRNSPDRFQNRWVSLVVSPKVQCCFLNGLKRLELPIRNGEGRLFVPTEKAELVKSYACLRYEENVNGSFDQIAGLTNSRGNVFGLMPHPEAFIRASQHPAWTNAHHPPALASAPGTTPYRASSRLSSFKEPPRSQPDGLAILENAYNALL